MKKIILIGSFALLGSLSFNTLAEIKPFEAVEYRKGIFKAFKWNFGPMADMVRGKVEFDAAEFTKRANNLKSLSTQPWEGFRPGTYDRSTSALPKIETEQAAYQQEIDKFEQAVINLAKAAETQDLKQIRPAFGQAGQSCKSCHDNYRD